LQYGHLAQPAAHRMSTQVTSELRQRNSYRTHRNPRTSTRNCSRLCMNCTRLVLV